MPQAGATRKALADLRSQRWFASDDIRGFAHRQRTQQMGMRREEFLSKPVIAILNTWSEASPCHAHLRDRAEAVKRGVAVSLCPSANQSSCTDSDSWTGGWIVFQDGAAAGTPSTAGAGAEIIRVWYALDGGSSFSGNGTRWLRFGADGAAGWNGNERSQRSFDLEARDCQDDQRRSITVTRLGRVNTERRACA